MLEPILKAIGGSATASTSWGTVPGWGLWATVVVAILVYGPRWNKQVADARAQKRSEGLAVEKEERSDLRDRIASLEALVTAQGVKIEALTGQAQDYQLKLVSALAAFRLLAGELEKLEPTNPVLRQATDLISMASTGSMGAGMDRMLDALAHVPATPERRTEQ